MGLDGRPGTMEAAHSAKESHKGWGSLLLPAHTSPQCWHFTLPCEQPFNQTTV